MNIKEYTHKLKNAHESLLIFLESENNSEEDYQNLTDIINEYEICNNKHEFTLFLHLISKISNFHRSSFDFNSKIERILENYVKDIQQKLTNSEIFMIFKGNKRILLFLFDKKIIFMEKFIIDKFFTQKYRNYKYPQYFLPEIKAFLNKNVYLKFIIQDINLEISKDFYELRKKGQNESNICKLIQKDSVEDFIKYVNKNNISLKSTINPSIYETSSFLVKKQIDSKITLIEYVTFYGSIQILKYIILNGVELTTDLWIYAIHSNNAEIIHFLEENQVEPKNERIQNIEENPFEKCLEESIKCHHNDISNYFFDNYFQNNHIKSNTTLIQSLKSYNLSFIQSELLNENFFYLCKYDYYSLVKFLLIENINQSSSYKNFEYKSTIKTALYEAIERENVEIVKLLLTNDNIDVNFGYKSYFDEYTALYRAIEIENIEIIKLLLTSDRLDINIECKHRFSKKTALYRAIEIGNVEIIRLLLTNDKIDINTGYTSSLESLKNYPWLAKSESKFEQKTSLYLAIEKENIEIIKLLLTNDKFDINIGYVNLSKSKFDYKYKNERKYVFEEYKYEKTTLYAAIEKRNVIIAKLLLEYDKIDINIAYKWSSSSYCSPSKISESNEMTALYCAIEKGQIEIIKLLLANDKIDINIGYKWFNESCMSKSESEKTSLYGAIEKGNIEIVKLLLTSDKLDINVGYKYKSSKSKFKTVLYRAIEKRNAEIIKLLLTNSKLDINIGYKSFSEKPKSHSMKTPLFLSIERGHINIIKILLVRTDLNINEKTVRVRYNKQIHAQTGLHLASKIGDLDIIELLLKKADIDINIKDHLGKKAIEYSENSQI